MNAIDHHYDRATPVEEAIEIRVRDTFGNMGVVIGSVTDRGLLDVYLAFNGMGHVLDQMNRKAHPPRKIVPGWQLELIEWIQGGHYKIEEIR